MRKIPIPIAFTRPMAARLLGVTLPAFDRIGLVPLHWSNIQPRYSRPVLELVLGCPITAEMVAEAEAALAMARRTQPGGRASADDEMAQIHV